MLTDSQATMLIAAAPLLAQGAPAAEQAGVKLLAVMGGEGVDRLDLRAAEVDPIDTYVSREPSRRGRHPVHLRHHRLAQGRHPHPAQHGDERDGDRRRPSSTCPPTT